MWVVEASQTNGQRGFVKRLIAIWKATANGAAIARVAAAAVAVVAVPGFIAFGSIARAHSYQQPDSCNGVGRRLSVATAIEEFHFETFNFQRAMLNCRPDRAGEGAG